MDRLFIAVKDRPTELTILCKSLIHSDIRNYINEVIFLDDNSEDSVTIGRIYSAFMFSMLGQGVKCRFVKNKFGEGGINDNWRRLKDYPATRVWGLDGDMMVFENYFERCLNILKFGTTFGNGSLLVSGFNTPIHPVSRVFHKDGCVSAPSVGGCSFLMHGEHLPTFLETLEKPNNNMGFDLHFGDVFDNILTANPSVSQHLGILAGINQITLAGFPGAFARIRG